MLNRAQYYFISLDRRTITMLFGALAALIGLVVLAGWHAHTIELVQFRPTLIPMQFRNLIAVSSFITHSSEAINSMVISSH